MPAHSPSPSLRCPFALHDPAHYTDYPSWACSISQYANLSRWRDHIKRAHDPDYNCGRCGARRQVRREGLQKFKSEHTSCKSEERSRPQIMTQEQLGRYRDLDWRGHNGTPIGHKVQAIWDALFPGVALPPALCNPSSAPDNRPCPHQPDTSSSVYVNAESELELPDSVPHILQESITRQGSDSYTAIPTQTRSDEDPPYLAAYGRVPQPDPGDYDNFQRKDSAIGTMSLGGNATVENVPVWPPAAMDHDPFVAMSAGSQFEGTPSWVCDGDCDCDLFDVCLKL